MKKFLDKHRHNIFMFLVIFTALGVGIIFGIIKAGNTYSSNEKKQIYDFNVLHQPKTIEIIPDSIGGPMPEDWN